MFERETLFGAYARYEEERSEPQQYTRPLEQIESFAKYQKRSDEHHYRTGCIDRPLDGERKMLYSEISEYPR